MCKNTTRVVRRHHYARVKNNRRQHWGGYGRLGWRCNQYTTDVEMPKDVAGMVARTPTPCSCHMCGNPRHASWENPLTIQERKAEEAYIYEIEEQDY